MKSQEEWTAVLEHEPIAVNEYYEFEETRELVLLVQDAAALIRQKGVAAFNEFRERGSHWRQEERYIFVLDPDGIMLVHPDPGMEYKNQMQLKDIQGKFIIRGLLDAAMAIENKTHGWYHYQWPVPGGLLPRWKSSYVERVTTADGKTFVVGSGMYNDRMERAFVVDTVMQAAAILKKEDRAAFKRFRDPKDAFRFKDAYLFVIDMNGVEWVNPAFPNIEGRKMLDLHDSQGKYLYRDMIQMIQNQGEGWLDYMWPKPGERISTQKSAFVKGVHVGDQTLMVGCGVYLEDAPVEKRSEASMNAEELMNHVRDAASLLEAQGEKAYPAFREKGSRWFHDDNYLFLFKPDGTRAFHAAEPESEGRRDIELRDIVGRPIVRMILDAASAPAGEGWVHYMYPEPGDLFPAWKSSFIKRLKFPSGEEHILGCGIYNMQMEPAFIEELVNRAATLIEKDGRLAFDQLRDKKGSFVFMDSYVFVQSPEGTELVNPGLPALEGKNLMELKDLKGRYVIKEQIAAAMKSSPVWVESFWYKPGSNKMALKKSFIRKVEHGGETLLVGAGMYGGEAKRLKG